MNEAMDVLEVVKISTLGIRLLRFFVAERVRDRERTKIRRENRELKKIRLFREVQNDVV